MKRLPLFLLIIWCISCARDTPYSFSPTPYKIPQRWGFPKMDIPKNNPMTEEGVELGRQLFFDPILSVDNTMSCASCHFPEQAFTDRLPVSTGVHGITGVRSAMSLVNVGYFYEGLFWDGRSPTLESQAILPVTDSSELAHTWNQVEWDLRKNQQYTNGFKAAFGISDTSELDRDLVVKAIAQFERSLVSKETRYDRFRKGEIEFTEQELLGYDLFFDISPGIKDAECGNCHNAPFFTTNEYANNGLQSAKTLFDFKDQGRGKITGNKYDNGKFRIPPLRNIKLTAPYMHDGRLKTLREVLEHYNTGGNQSPNVHSLIRPLELTEEELQALEAFMMTI